MATQSCAPAQGRSSRSEPSSTPHIGCTRRQREKNRGRGERGCEGGVGWGGLEGEKKNYFKVTNPKHFSDVVPGLRPPVCPHADADARGHADSPSRVLSTIKKQTNKKKRTSGLGACKFFCQLIKYLSGQWESEGYSGCRRNEQRSSALCFPFSNGASL